MARQAGIFFGKYVACKKEPEHCVHVAGLYADLDFEVLKPFDKLITKESLVLAAMTDDLSFNHRIPNAWMASAPKHPFWNFCIQQIVAAATPCAWQPKKKCAHACPLIF